MNKPTIYLQDADGNERTLNVTEPDPADGTYCAHMDNMGQAWIRIVPNEPARYYEDRLGGIVEAALNHCQLDEKWMADMASDPTIDQTDVDGVFVALEGYITEHLARK